MDSKIMAKGYRLKVMVLIALAALSMTGCKENKWADWKVQNEVWLENNKKQPGVVETSSGLQYKIISDPMANNGEPQPNTTSVIYCDYTVKLINGNVVESNHYVGIDLSSTIPGFAEGCHKIHTHGDIEMYIPAYLGYDYSKYQTNEYSEAEGYGSEGNQSYIPPYSTLIYSLHLCGISE